MKILIVEDDSILLSFLARELQSRGYEIVQTQFGDRGLDLYKKHGPWAFVLSDYKFFPGPEIKDGVQLVTAIHMITPFQPMAIMTADPKEARENLPRGFAALPLLRKPFRIGQLLRQLCCRFAQSRECLCDVFMVLGRERPGLRFRV